MEDLIKHMVEDLGYTEEVAREIVETSCGAGLLDVPIHMS